MEINGKIAKAGQLMPTSQRSQLNILEGTISLYDGELTTECWIKNVKKMKAAFPAIAPGFYDVLADMVKEDGFSDARLNDAVRNMIKTCIYPTPTIANVLSWDKRVKIYSYTDICDLVMAGARWDEYQEIKRGSRTYWVKLSEAEQYGIDLKPKQQ